MMLILGHNWEQPATAFNASRDAFGLSAFLFLRSLRMEEILMTTAPTRDMKVSDHDHDEGPRLLSKYDVERVYGIRANQLPSLVKDGVLTCVRVGRRVMYNREVLEEFVRGGGKSLPGGWRRKPEDDELMPARRHR